MIGLQSAIESEEGEVGSASDSIPREPRGLVDSI
jgi:hypothetical protein